MHHTCNIDGTDWPLLASAALRFRDGLSTAARAWHGSNYLRGYTLELVAKSAAPFWITRWPLHAPGR